MFGQQRYKLPGSKKRQAQVEPEEPIEVGGPVEAEDVDFEASYPSDEVYEGDERYDDDDYEYDVSEGGDSYFFEEEKEPVKAPVAPVVQFESNRPDIATFEALSTRVEQEEVIEEIEKQEGEKREYHARDESTPFDSPPGYVWAFEQGTRVPWFGVDHFFNALGFGDSSKRYRLRTEFEEEEAPADLIPLPGSQAIAQQRREEYLARQVDLQEAKEFSKRKDFNSPTEQEEEDEDEDPEDFFLRNLTTPEPEEGPRGWLFWHGPRWEHWFHGYESPTSLTGYPVQWFYRTTHLFFPDLYDSFKYERHFGEVTFRGFRKSVWWFVSHPCIPTIFLNFALVVPFVFYRQFKVRSKIIENRIATGRSLFRTLEEHFPIILRRMNYRAIKRKRRRWFRWVLFFTFAFHPNCWDLIGHSVVNPTEEWWDKNYINKYTDGIETQSGDLKKWMDMKPPTNEGLVIKPYIEALNKFYTDAEKSKEMREERRKEIFGTQGERADGWKELAAEEQRQRYASLQRKSATETVADRAKSNDL